MSSLTPLQGHNILSGIYALPKVKALRRVELLTRSDVFSALALEDEETLAQEKEKILDFWRERKGAGAQTEIEDAIIAKVEELFSGNLAMLESKIQDGCIRLLSKLNEISHPNIDIQIEDGDEFDKLLSELQYLIGEYFKNDLIDQRLKRSLEGLKRTIGTNLGFRKINIYILKERIKFVTDEL